MKIPNQSVKNSTLLAAVLLAGFSLLFAAGNTHAKNKTELVKTDVDNAAASKKDDVKNGSTKADAVVATKVLLDFGNKKDPFKPYLADTPKSAKSSSRSVAKSDLPIHGVAVEQFKLIALVADAMGNRAMVEDPSGNSYILKQGMTIGVDEAKITRIDKNGVEAVRYYYDDLGTKQKETLRILMQREP